MAQAQVEEARTGDLQTGEDGSLQLGLLTDGLGDLPGIHAQRLCRLHGKGGCEIAVLHILGDLHRSGLKRMGGQQSFFRRLPIGFEDQALGLLLCVEHMIHKVKPPNLFFPCI